MSVLRKELADLRDGSAVLVAIGPLTNIRDLLISAADQHSRLDGRALVAAKVRTLVVMAGDFSKPKAEFNVFSDLDAASSVFTNWPTVLVACPYEMGEWIHFPEQSLEKDFRFPVPHPLLIADLASFGGKRNGFMPGILSQSFMRYAPIATISTSPSLASSTLIEQELQL